jgi:phage terminase small subunit
MARPPANAPVVGTRRALTKLPKAPKWMSEEEAAVYARDGQLLVDAGTLAATDLPMLEASARVEARIFVLRRDPESSDATIAALERLRKEQLVQLGLTPAARRAVQRLEAPSDPEGDRLRGLL